MTDPTDIDNLDAWLDGQFPSRQERTYANHAAIAPWPKCVADAITAFTMENLRDGAQHYARWLRETDALRERIARIINAGSGDDIALTANTTEGVDIVARGLPWRAGDNIVSVEGEFPTNRLAWERLASRGVELRRVDIRAAEDPEAALVAQFDDRTRLLAVSAVQWIDGFRLDLDRLGKACRDNGTAFFVDAIQQLGALPMDVQAAQVDFLACGGHKWLLAPEGIGLFYAAPRWRDELVAARVGWRMRERPYDFDHGDQRDAAGGRRFEPGTPNTLGQVALNAALEMHEQVGRERVGQRVLANTGRLVDGLGAISGARVLSRWQADRRSGIVAFQPGTASPKIFCGRLERQNVICAPRGKCVRISPHFYQGKEDIDRILEAIGSAMSTD